MFYSSTFLMLGGLHTLLCDGGLKKSRLVIFSSQIISCSPNLGLTFFQLFSGNIDSEQATAAAALDTL